MAKRNKPKYAFSRSTYTVTYSHANGTEYTRKVATSSGDLQGAIRVIKNYMGNDIDVTAVVKDDESVVAFYQPE